MQTWSDDVVGSRPNRHKLVVRPARSEEYELVGELTAGAYVVDGLIEADSDYVHRLKDARDRAEAAELLVAVEYPAARVVGSVTFAQSGSRYAELARDAGEADFRMLAVAPEARNRGTGEALVRACIDRAVTLGVRRLLLSSSTKMLAAHRLYQRLGFTRVPGLDWSPVPQERLLAFTKDIRAN